MSVSWGWNNFENTIINCKNGHIKSSSSQIENENVFLTIFFVQTIGNCGSCGFIQNSYNVKARNCSSVFCGLSLSIIKVSWDCNDSVNYFLTNKNFSNFFHFSQNHSRNFFWGKLLLLIIYQSFYVWFSVFINYFIREINFIRLDCLVKIFSSN